MAPTALPKNKTCNDAEMATIAAAAAPWLIIILWAHTPPLVNFRARDTIEPKKATQKKLINLEYQFTRQGVTIFENSTLTAIGELWLNLLEGAHANISLDTSFLRLSRLLKHWFPQG